MPFPNKMSWSGWIKCHNILVLQWQQWQHFLFSSWKPIYNIYKDSVQRHLWAISITLPWPFTEAIRCWLHSLTLSGRLKVMGLSEHLIWAISPSVERFQVEKKHRVCRTLKKRTWMWLFERPVQRIGHLLLLICIFSCESIDVCFMTHTGNFNWRDRLVTVQVINLTKWQTTC